MVRLAFAIALCGWLVASAASAAEPDAARQAELKHLLRHDCGACHGMTLEGGLGTPLVPARLAAMSDAALIETILDGRTGTPMPPWRFIITPDEAAWLVRLMKEGVDDVE